MRCCCCLVFALNLAKTDHAKPRRSRENANGLIAIRHDLLEGSQYEPLGPDMLDEHFQHKPWQLLLNCAPKPEQDVEIRSEDGLRSLVQVPDKCVKNDTGLPLVVRVFEVDSVATVQANFDSGIVDVALVETLAEVFARCMEGVDRAESDALTSNFL